MLEQAAFIALLSLLDQLLEPLQCFSFMTHKLKPIIQLADLDRMWSHLILIDLRFWPKTTAISSNALRLLFGRCIRRGKDQGLIFL